MNLGANIPLEDIHHVVGDDEKDRVVGQDEFLYKCAQKTAIKLKNTTTAGHYEEVDYSKEVVFEDSSDEDSPKEEKKGRAHSVSVLCDGHACIHAASHLYVN